MSLEQAQADKRGAQLREWKAKLELLRARADQADEARIQYHKEIDSLRSQFDSLQSRLSEIKASSGQAWPDVKTGFDGAWDQFKTAFENASSRFGGSD